MADSRYECLGINGPVSVYPVTSEIPFVGSYRFLIMGPTGAGKSSFIEALAGNSQLKISGDQLASVTQSVTPYLLANVYRAKSSVYIVDTPGFSDSKISEGEIVDMVERWKKDNGLFIDHVLFLIPITATRIEGSKRRTLKMMRELVDAPEANLSCITFVTTMWDQLSSENAKQRAESNFIQLESVILKDWIRKDARLTRFNNDQSSASALKVLDNIDADRSPHFYPRPALFYPDLHERISTALQEKQMVEEQLTNPNNNDTLNTLLKKNHEDNEDLLVKFIGQLLDKGYANLPEGYKAAHMELTVAISALGEELQGMEGRVQKRREAKERCEAQERRELERQRLVRESKLGFRVRRKIEHAKGSFTGIFKHTS